jgi:hypothetical protein
MRHHRRLPMLAALAASLLLPAAAVAAPAAAATSTDLAPVTDATAMSAYGGWVVWSERRPDGVWGLVAFHDGAKTQLAATPRSVPFDSDIGPGRDGRPTVMFSRCTTERDVADRLPWSRSATCRLRALDPATGVEKAAGVPRPAGASDSTPSLWRGRVGFQRRTRGARFSQLMIYDPATGRTRRLPHGTVPTTCPSGHDCTGAGARGEVDALDLGARTVAFIWRIQAPSVMGTGTGWEARADRLSDGRSVLAGNGYSSGACGGRFPLSPNATADGLWFLNKTIHCDGIEGIITSAPIATGRLSAAHPPTGVAWLIARDGATTYAVLGPGHTHPEAPLAADALKLVRLDGVVPKPTGKRASGPFV